MWQGVVAWAKRLKRDVVALFLATRDPRTPWAAKTIAAIVVAYAVSPIDLIPDFIPVLGLLDDIILVPIGIAIVIRLIPKPLMDEFRARAHTEAASIDVRWGMWIVLAVWLTVLALVGVWIWPRL